MKAASPATRIGTSTAASTYIPVSVTPPMRTLDWNGWGYVVPCAGSGLRLGMYVSASNSCDTPRESSSNLMGELLRARRGATRNRSTRNPVSTPTVTARMNAAHQFHCQSSTHLATRSAESVPSWAWARLRNRFDL